MHFRIGSPENDIGLPFPQDIVPADAAATVRNIAASDPLFRLSIVSNLIRQTLLMALPLILYKLLKPVVSIQGFHGPVHNQLRPHTLHLPRRRK